MAFFQLALAIEMTLNLHIRFEYHLISHSTSHSIWIYFQLVLNLEWHLLSMWNLKGYSTSFWFEITFMSGLNWPFCSYCFESWNDIWVLFQVYGQLHIDLALTLERVNLFWIHYWHWCSYSSLLWHSNWVSTSYWKCFYYWTHIHVRIPLGLIVWLRLEFIFHLIWLFVWISSSHSTCFDNWIDIEVHTKLLLNLGITFSMSLDLLPLGFLKYHGWCRGLRDETPSHPSMFMLQWMRILWTIKHPANSRPTTTNGGRRGREKSGWAWVLSSVKLAKAEGPNWMEELLVLTS